VGLSGTIYLQSGGGIVLKDRIKEIRKSVGLNQSDFGAKVGVKGNTIGNYEIGLRSPSDAVIFSICREFNVNENWLRTGEGEMFLKINEEEELYSFLGGLAKEENSSFKKRLISALSRLNESDWEMLEKISDKMVQKKDDA
jgi:transcriptional regulator with XRE-family HTH domain